MSDDDSSKAQEMARQMSEAMEALGEGHAQEAMNRSAHQYMSNKVAKVRMEHERGGTADTMHRALCARLEEFSSTLDAGEEVGMCLSNFGSSITISITSVDYEMPFLMVLRGFDAEDKPVTLLQHTSQVNFLLVRIPVPEGREPRKVVLTN